MSLLCWYWCSAVAWWGENVYFWVLKDAFSVHLKEAVGPGDAVKAEDSHVEESQAQPSISHRVLHVSHPALGHCDAQMGIGQSDDQKPTKAT